ncbi:MAG TPA: hypothetical protein VEB42_02345 [Chitinophagaceae bacterium]|nr:hypothetical protein [Chitinophagaceae bacterium]
MKKLFRFLQLFDAIWSLPLMLTAFWLVGIFSTAVFGMAAGTYDIGFFQPLFLAMGIVIGAANAGLGFLYFFARGLFKWFYGRKDEEGELYLPAVKDWQGLKPQYKFALFFFVLFAIMAMIIFVYVQFV